MSARTRRPAGSSRPPRTKLKLPVSGSEPLFSDLVYGTPRGILNNNCYAWALDAYRSSGGIKLQPGNMSRQTTDLNASSCAFLKDRTLDDSRARGIYSTAAQKRCRPGFYKIMAFIDKGRDYHWYKQHRNLLYRVSPGETLRSISRDMQVPPANVVSATKAPLPGDLVYVRNADMFSHKQGLATGPLLRDAAQRTIPDPRTANRNYGSFNYRTYCGSYCVRNIRPTNPAKAPTRKETERLHSLLNKRIGLLEAGGEQGGQLPRRRPKVQRRNGRKVKV